MEVCLICIVVPVFNAKEQTQRCLQALSQNTLPSQAKVLVIDDCSGECEIDEVLGDLPRTWAVLRNRRNLGFVGTANLGFALAGRDDVILLNSDTEVSQGWLQAIERCAASDLTIGSITPLTNNGEIASIPTFCHSNPYPVDPDLWALAVAKAGMPIYPEVPTAVGFCMYLRRAALDEVGAFDEVTFGRGYGEENDWCCRATAAGWRHVICDDAFVAHEGGASFGPLGLKPGGSAMERLLARHPDYLARVQSFIEQDPMAERRRAINRAFQSLADGMSSR